MNGNENIKNTRVDHVEEGVEKTAAVVDGLPKARVISGDGDINGDGF
jgi:hypothetical protein